MSKAYIIAACIIAACLLILSLGIASCNSSSDGMESESRESVQAVRPDESSLKARVEARWDALIRRDFAGAYRYLSPGYRKLFSVEKYSSGFGSVVEWQSIEITNVAIEEKRATVGVDVFYQLAIPSQQDSGLGGELGLINSSMSETWLWVDGDWWYVVPSESKGV